MALDMQFAEMSCRNEMQGAVSESKSNYQYGHTFESPKYLKAWISLVEGDEGCIGPSGKLLFYDKC